MVLAWYMNDSQDDPRKEHHLNPPQFVPIDNIYPLSKVEYFKVDVDNLEEDEVYLPLRKQRGYNYEDVVEISPDKLPDYNSKIKMFYTEHLHDDEEIRLILAGSGYFDIRDITDKWIRIQVVKGDLLILPAGIYHRFTTDEKNYAKAIRLFSGNPVWIAHDRPSDDRPGRKIYIEGIADLPGKGILSC